MDKYTKKTRQWLDQRFKLTDSEGVYFAHQPIYGFRKGPTEADLIGRYIITFQTMNMLAYLNFNSFLDVGGAEGYKAALVKSLFNVEVRSSDLSGEACKRAKEIYNIDGDPIDIQKLPYNDNQFDVVLCSETLEHVPNFTHATLELLRVSRKAVVITVPHESDNVIKRYIKNPHAHLHSFKTNSFNFSSDIAKKIIYKKIIFSPLNFINRVLYSKKRSAEECTHFLSRLNNLAEPLTSRIFGEKTAICMMNTDCIATKFLPFYSGFLFVLFKDFNCYSKTNHMKITPRQIIDFKVPLHKLNQISDISNFK